ncbi:MAG TPA: YegP family protein [Anaerolineales bacterium]|nr:YegP family protein [Anaerolineales bacterium]
MAAQYQIRHAADGRFYFNLTAENNKIILTSEMYAAKEGALGGVDSVRANGPLIERYDRRTSIDEQDYFVLQAANGEIIGQSEMYRSKAAMENGLLAVQRVAAEAAVNDQT